MVENTFKDKHTRFHFFFSLKMQQRRDGQIIF